MLDKNRKEIKTGMIVEITGAYFKNDNGLYFVEHSPGDPSWCGTDHCLKKISKKGKISTAKSSTCFWPIAVFVSSREKRFEALEWNEQHAKIEICSVTDVNEIVDFFNMKIDSAEKDAARTAWDWGEESERVKTDREIAKHYKNVVEFLLA